MASYKKMPNGKWQVSFYCKNHLHENKKFKKMGFSTKKEATEYMNDFISRYKGGNDMKLRLLIDEYYMHKVDKNIKPGTLKNYKSVSDYLKLYFKDIMISEITPNAYIKCLNYLNYAPTQKRLVHKYVKSLIKYGEFYHSIKNISFVHVDVDMKYKKKEKKILTLNEFNEFITTVGNTRTRVLFETLYWTGMRIGEACALTYKDIDFEKRTISVTKTRFDRDVIDTPKTESSIRVISIPNVLYESLKKFFEIFPVYKHGFIFGSPSTYQHYLMETNTGLTTHSFRHSHVSLLLSRGVDIPTVSKRLGHQNSQITMQIYAHMLEDSDNALDVLNEYTSEYL